jgi:isopropylmalate/homocitrate/citramalate synthase
MEEEDLVRNYVLEKEIIKGLPEKVIFWEETLRDGEQTPGVFFTVDEKLKIAKMLDDMGVGIMDVGIPVVSEEEFKAVKAIADEGLKATIIGAARTVLSDIDACVKAGVDETSIFVACSDLHLKYKLLKTREEVLDISVKSVEYAREHGLDVSFVTEDTVRADLDYVVELYNACTEAGAQRAVLCDTVGVMTPAAMRWWLGVIKKRFKPVQLSIHCHNDFGMAVANSLAAVECGVEIPHTTVNGIGERSGNASFEELVLSLEMLYGYDTGIDFSRLYELSTMVEEISGIPLAINKPVVGYNAFSHESGIHADGVLKKTLTYEPIDCEAIGRVRRFIFGKHTGHAAVADKLDKAGISATPEQITKVVQGIKEMAEHKEKKEEEEFIKMFRQREEERRGISDREFWELAKSAGLKPPE